jgi:hypothetical protein
MLERGQPTAFIRSKVQDAGKFANLIQRFSAYERYRGKRLRLSGYVKTIITDQWSTGAGLWFRLDDRYSTLTMDNLSGREIKGDTDWTRLDLVLDVPQQTTQMVFGLLMRGCGTAWLDELSLEIVGSDVPVTANFNFEPTIWPEPNREPANFDFTPMPG